MSWDVAVSNTSNRSVIKWVGNEREPGNLNTERRINNKRKEERAGEHTLGGIV